MNGSACKNCDKLSKCTKGKYRSIVEQLHQRFADVVDVRTQENMDIFKKRKCLAEHPFGTVKRAFGYTYFLTRRTESVRAESCMHFFIYNLKRVLQIMGIQEVIQTV